MSTTEIAEPGESLRPAESADPARARRARLGSLVPDDAPWGWLAPLLVALLAGVLRFVRLGYPGGKVFDEVYYADEAHDLLQKAVEWDYKTNGPEYVVHPPLGKWVIAVGEKLLGYDAFGWRFSTALLGTLSVLIVARVGRRLFGSTLIGSIAGLLLAVDGLAIVMSRTALLDGILTFWVLAGFAALVVDRDHARARLLAEIEAGAPVSGRGPRLGWRPWRFVAALCLGAAVATKWNGLFYVAAFGLLTVLWDLGARRAAGITRPWLGTLTRDAVPAFFTVVGTTAVVYLASWSGWFFTSDGYFRHWAQQQPGHSQWSWVPAPLRSLWHYHYEAYQFNANLHAFHPYKSNPWSWLILGRPVMFFYEQPKAGQKGCDLSGGCAQAITGLGNPALWWGGVIAVVVLAWAWAARRDWRAGAILLGIAAGYLPWFHYQSRTIFQFYMVVLTPFLALAVAMVLGMVLGPAAASPRRRQIGAIAVGGYLAIVVVLLFYFWPVLTATNIPVGQFYDRMWFPSWI